MVKKTIQITILFMVGIFWLMVAVMMSMGCTTMKYELYQPSYYDCLCDRDYNKDKCMIWWAMDRVRTARYSHTFALSGHATEWW